MLTSPLLGGGYLRRPASQTIGVVTLRALCQEREQEGPSRQGRNWNARFLHRCNKKTREPLFYQ